MAEIWYRVAEKSWFNADRKVREGRYRPWLYCKMFPPLPDGCSMPLLNLTQQKRFIYRYKLTGLIH
ncbi:hypothetical protein SAMN04487951_11020 [Vreelandella arcis]|uniref:Uncharacterized protein n=1 Tax=Vreelandella arcis TaxID=416873 RepID=A0A1H0FHC6_9GAMM|nr:hypothetical protein SAMN04487951_11020 [Halomonas arcis]